LNFDVVQAEYAFTFQSWDRLVSAQLYRVENFVVYEELFLAKIGAEIKQHSKIVTKNIARA